METIMMPHLWGYISNKIDRNQFGGIQGKSTTMAVIQLLDSLYKGSDTNKISRVLMIDFSKAFDRIDHTILLRKIIQLGVPGWLCKWAASFLQNRTQRTKYKAHYSEWERCIAGVPQGTKFGPLGFIVLINDLNVDLKFIDDSTVIEILDNPNDSKLEIRCREIEQWCRNNYMKLNTSKSIVLEISFRKKNVDWQPLVLDSETVQSQRCARLLGFYINDKLDWSDHIDVMIQKVTKRIYFIRLMIRSGFKVSDIVYFYTAFIRSIMEYGSPAFHFSLTSEQSDRIEFVQKRVLKMIEGISYYNHDYYYKDLLSKHKMQTLEKRRLKACNTLYHDIVTDKVHALNHLIPYHKTTKVTLRNKSMVSNIFCRTQRYQGSFIPSAILTFNNVNR